jgi:hypothetical protein
MIALRENRAIASPKSGLSNFKDANWDYRQADLQLVRSPVSDTEQWRKVELLVAHGFLFQSVYEQSEGVGQHKVVYPSTLIEAEAFVVEYRMQAVRG